MEIQKHFSIDFLNFSCPSNRKVSDNLCDSVNGGLILFTLIIKLLSKADVILLTDHQMKTILVTVPPFVENVNFKVRFFKKKILDIEFKIFLENVLHNFMEKNNYLFKL